MSRSSKTALVTVGAIALFPPFWLNSGGVNPTRQDVKMPRLVAAQIQNLQASDPAARAEAACQLGLLGQQASPAISRLTGLLGDTAAVGTIDCGGERWGWQDGGRNACSTSPSIEAARALARIGRPALEAVVAALRHVEQSVRQHAAMALGFLDQPEAVPPLLAAMRDDAGRVRASAARALGQIEDGRASQALAGALKDVDWEVRQQAAWALGQLERPDSVDALAGALADEHPKVREMAAWALGQIERRSAVPALIKALKDVEWKVREKACWALGQIGDPSSADSLAGALKDEHPKVRKNAAWALGEMKGS
jgi:HEAT repeat protein